MSYVFLDIETIPSLDEYDNPINLGSDVIPSGIDVVIIRPDAIVDIMTLVSPKACDGQVLHLTSLDSVWAIDFMAPAGSGTTFWIPAGGLSLMVGQSIKMMFVSPENKWYVLDIQ